MLRGAEDAQAMRHYAQRADRLMNAQLDGPGAAWLQSYLEGIGIQVVTHASVMRYEGSPILEVAQRAHGPRVKADVCVAALKGTPRIVLQLKCEGIDPRSQGEIVVREGGEDFHAREGQSGDSAWWRLVVRHGQLAGGLYVGPPGTAKAFIQLLQQPVDLAPLRAGSLDGLKRTARA